MPIADLTGNLADAFTAETAQNFTSPQGFCLALDAGALDAAPLWTRIDSIREVRIQQVNIRRGRSDERELMAMGEMTITGLDLDGVLDPTNVSSPFYSGSDTELNPRVQAAFGLQNPVTGNWVTIYRGYLEEIDYDIDLSGKFASFTIHCDDATGILSDAEGVPGGAGDNSFSATGDAVYLAAHVDDRIIAALADAALSVGVTEWPADLMEIYSGNIGMPLKTYAPRSKILSVVDDATTAEFPGIATRYVSKTGVFTFHGRQARFNPGDESYGIHTWLVGDVPAFNADNDTALISGLTLARSKDNLINAALITPVGILDADIAGQFVKDATSIGKYGAHSISFENLEIADTGNASGFNAKDEAKSMSQYWVDNFKAPQNRVKKVKFVTQAPDSLQGPQWWNLVCNVELNDIATLTTTHKGGGSIFAEDYFFEGLTYEIRPMKATHWEVELTADLSPRAWFPDGYFS